MWDQTNLPEISCSLVSLILLENNIELSSENFQKIFKATNIKIESFWYSWFFTKVVGEKTTTLENLKSSDKLTNQDKIEPAGEKEDKSEKKEESDEDMGFGLFD